MPIPDGPRRTTSLSRLVYGWYRPTLPTVDCLGRSDGRSVVAGEVSIIGGGAPLGASGRQAQRLRRTGMTKWTARTAPLSRGPTGRDPRAPTRCKSSSHGLSRLGHAWWLLSAGIPFWIPPFGALTQGLRLEPGNRMRAAHSLSLGQLRALAHWSRVQLASIARLGRLALLCALWVPAPR